MPEKLSAFSAGNGDTILLEAHGKTVLTDIHYRAAAEDPSVDEAPDFRPDIRFACADGHLNVFVLTHPDKDHLTGFDKIFHTGKPEKWQRYPKDGEEMLLVDEIWCSPYAANPHYVTEAAEALSNEIWRRKELKNAGDPAAGLNGNRLVIMDTSTHTSGSVTRGLDWLLLAPTREEWDIPKTEPPTSSNPTSLVIRWTVRVGTRDNLIMLGGDSTVDVWKRLEAEVLGNSPDDLAWNILVAPHHCSRHTLGRAEDGEDGEFEDSQSALDALGEQRDKGFIVSSSRIIVRNGNSPPSFYAKNRYLRILARGGDINDDAVRRRFRCTGGDATDKSPAHVVFELTASGPLLKQKNKAKAAAAVAASSVGRGGGYG